MINLRVVKGVVVAALAGVAVLVACSPGGGVRPQAGNETFEDYSLSGVDDCRLRSDYPPLPGLDPGDSECPPPGLEAPFLGLPIRLVRHLSEDDDQLRRLLDREIWGEMLVEPLAVEVEDEEGNRAWISFTLYGTLPGETVWEDQLEPRGVSELIKIIAGTPSVPAASVIPPGERPDGPADLEASVIYPVMSVTIDARCFPAFAVKNKGPGAVFLERGTVLAEVEVPSGPPVTVLLDPPFAILPQRSLDLTRWVDFREEGKKYDLTVDPNIMITETDETNNQARAERPHCELR